MAFRKWFGPLIAGGLVAVIAGGCSSTPAASKAKDAGPGRTFDAGLTDGSGLGAGGFDGTTGQTCATDDDCLPSGGPGINRCSIDYASQFQITNVLVDLWATPVCIMAPDVAPCDPDPTGANDGYPHFCDGPDDPSSPGICYPDDPNDPHTGFCYPQCTFAIDGSAPVGCAGTNTCNPLTFIRSETATQPVTGFGFCAGGCQQDSDCHLLGADFQCQTDIGYCTQAKVQRTKAIGTACATTATTDDLGSGACYCDEDFTTGVGSCSTSCIVGGVPCADGWVCDLGFQSPLVFSSSSGASASVPITLQNKGLPGVCRVACAATGGGGNDAGETPIEAGTADAGETLTEAGTAGADAATDPDAAVTAADAAVEGASEGGTTLDAGPVLAFDAGSAHPIACPPNTACSSTNLAGPDCVP
jgi:hypothetical protein